MTDETKTTDEADQNSTENVEQNGSQNESGGAEKATKKKAEKKKTAEKKTTKKAAKKPAKKSSKKAAKKPAKKSSKKKRPGTPKFSAKDDTDDYVELPGDQFNKLVVGAKNNATNDDDKRFAESFKQTPFPEVSIKEVHADRLAKLANLVADPGDDEDGDDEDDDDPDQGGEG